MHIIGLQWLTRCLLLLLIHSSASYGLSQWKNYYYYRAGSLVVHPDNDGSLVKYRATKPSKDSKPSANSDDWQAISVVNPNNQIPRDQEAITPNLPATPSLPPTSIRLPDSPTMTNGIEQTVLPSFNPKPANTILTNSPIVPEGSPYDVNQETIRQSSEEWSAQTFYLRSELTRYNGTQYQARWSNSGMIPGKTDAWIISNEPGNHHRWQQDHIYPVAGLRVLYEDHIYENTNWTLSDEPGQSSVWFLVESAHDANAAPWDISRHYTVGELVAYQDYIYRSRWNNSGQTPGKTDAWIIVYDDDKQYYWKPDHVYPVAGNQVIHNDNIYFNSRWTLGEEPGTSPVWVLEAPADLIDNWHATKQYGTDDLVKYSNRYYVSLQKNLNEIPGQTDAWSLSDHEDTIYPWIKEHTYPRAGVKVRHLNKIYQNTGWTRGDLPDSDSSTLWELVTNNDDGENNNTNNENENDNDNTYDQTHLVNCKSPTDSTLEEWQPGNNYLMNETIQHSVQLDGQSYTLSWRSRWAINPGEEPGVNSGWVLLLEDNGRCPWSPYYTYSDADDWNQVTHKGKVYIRKFWTLNEEPGNTIEVSPWELVK